MGSKNGRKIPLEGDAFLTSAMSLISSPFRAAPNASGAFLLAAHSIKLVRRTARFRSSTSRFLAASILSSIVFGIFLKTPAGLHEAVKFFFSPSAVNGFPGDARRLFRVGGNVPGDKRRGGVHHRYIPQGAAFFIQYIKQLFRVLFRRAALYFRDIRLFQAEFLLFDLVRGRYLFFGNVPDYRFPADGQLVEAVFAMN